MKDLDEMLEKMEDALPRDIGKKVSIRTMEGQYPVTGRVKAYITAPFYVIERDDKKGTILWPVSLTDVE